MNKKIIRQELRLARKNIPPYQRAEFNHTIVNKVINLDIFNQAKNIAGYWSSDGEVDLSELIQKVFTEKKQFYLPVIQNKKKALKFYLYESNSAAKLNDFHILEPLNTREIKTTELDLVLVPLVGFDENCNRIGRGGGYYDKTFHFLQQTKRPAKPYLLGIGYELQKIILPPLASWDLQLDGIITETSWLLRRDIHN